MTITAILKRTLRPILLGAADAWLFEVLARLDPPGRAAPDALRRVLVLAPAGAGSLGDEAMTRSAVHAIGARLPGAPITLIIFKETDRAVYGDLGADMVCLDGFMGMRPRLGTLRRLMAALRQGTDFVILGADVLDGIYQPSNTIRRLWLAVAARRAGLSSNLIGFSFADRAGARVRAFLRDHCSDLNIISRDPISAARVAETVGRPVPSAADLAFLLPRPDAPSPAAAAPLAQVTAWRAEGRPVLVFNGNAHGLKTSHPDIDVAACTRAFAEALTQVNAASSCGLAFVSHDDRPGVSDADFIRRIIALLPSGLPITMADAPIRPGDGKLICEQADLTITGRMHLGIASLGVATPALFYDYQGKVEGLLGLFDLPDMKFAAEDVLAPERLAAMALDRMDRRAEISTRIEARLPAIRALSARNIDMVVNGSVTPDA
jgi:colanic acid/amylovoran biosynthesis protein